MVFVIVDILKVSAVLAWSTFVATRLVSPATYFAVGLFFAFGAIVLLLERTARQKKLELPTDQRGEPLIALGIGLGLGVLWPSFPFIMFFESVGGSSDIRTAADSTGARLPIPSPARRRSEEA